MMGSSASISKTKKFTKEQLSLVASSLLDLFKFERYADVNGTVSFDDLINIFASKTDVFLTHDWGTSHVNHQRVAKINAALKKRGIRTWFDEEQMDEDIKSKMTSGIDNSTLVIVCITEEYMSKVSGSNAEDNCRLEFGYASRRKSVNMMLPVVMEPKMRDTSNWIGQVGLVLGGSLYVDFSRDDIFDSAVDELFNRIIKHIGTPINTAIDNIDWSLLEDGSNSSSSSRTSPSSSFIAPSPPTALFQQMAICDKAITDAIFKWFMQELKIVDRVAKKYTAMLLDADVGSIDKLQKKLKRNRQFLTELGFHEDDVEDILNKLLPDDPKKEPNTSGSSKINKIVASTGPVRTYSNSAVFSGHTSSIFGIVLLPDGHVATAGQDHSIRIWDVDTRQCVRILAGHTNSVVGIQLLRDGSLLSGGLDRMVRVWNLLSGLVLQSFTGHMDSVFTVLELPERTGDSQSSGLVMSGSADRTLKIWRRSSGMCVTTLIGHTDGVQFAMVLQDGNVISASWDRTMRLWNPASGECLRVLNDHTGEVLHVSQLTDGRIVSASMDATIKLFDPESMTCRRTLVGHTINARWTTQLDSTHICSGSKDKTLRIWNLDTGVTEQTLTGHTDYVRCVLYLSDGRILSGSDDKTMRIWY